MEKGASDLYGFINSSPFGFVDPVGEKLEFSILPVNAAVPTDPILWYVFGGVATISLAAVLICKKWFQACLGAVFAAVVVYLVLAIVFRGFPNRPVDLFFWLFAECSLIGYLTAFLTISLWGVRLIVRRIGRSKDVPPVL
jgi:hypothetical protein